MQISGTIARTAVIIVTLCVWIAMASDPFGYGGRFAPPGAGISVDLPFDCRLRHSDVRVQEDGSVAWTYEFIVYPDDIVTVSGTTYRPAQEQTGNSDEFLLWTDNALTVTRREIVPVGGRHAAGDGDRHAGGLHRIAPIPQDADGAITARFAIAPPSAYARRASPTNVRPIGSSRSGASTKQFLLIHSIDMSIDPQQFIQASMAGLRELTAAHDGAWGIGHIARWNADLESGQLVFTLDNGTTATAAMQIVGTYDTEHGTFLWAWDNPSVPTQLKSAAELARKWGEENDQTFYTSPGLKCPEEQAWEFAAVTTRLAGANGAYRGPSGTTHIFMTFGEITLSKPTA